VYDVGILNIFKKKQQESSDFSFPNDDDLELPPPPPSTENTPFKTEEKHHEEPISTLPDSSTLDFEQDMSKHGTKEESHPGFPELPDLEHDFDNIISKHEEHQATKDVEKKPEIHSPMHHIESVQKEIATTQKVTVEPTTITKRKSFMKIEEFREVLNTHTSINNQVKSLSQSLLEISKKSHEEDQEFENWHKQANTVLKKLSYIDRVLFEQSMNQ
jgi:hypothetical protein